MASPKGKFGGNIIWCLAKLIFSAADKIFFGKNLIYCTAEKIILADGE